MSAGVSGHLLQALFLVASLAWLFLVVRTRLPARLRGRTVLVVALLLRLPFLFWGEYSNDLHRYAWEGRIQWEGYSPYAHAPADPALTHLRDARQVSITHPELTTIYPPLAQATFALAWKAGLRETGFRNLVLGLDLLVVVVLLGWLRATGRPPGRALVYAWCPLAIGSVAVGHIDPLMLLALAGAAWAWEGRRPYAAAALLGAAVLAKTMAIVCLPWLLLRRPRAALGALVPVVVLGYLPYWTWGGDGTGGVRVFATLIAFGRDFAFNGSLFRVAEWLTPSAGAARLVVAALFAGWAALVSVAQPRLPAAAALLFAGLLLLSPTVHFWYLTWFLVFLPAVGARRWTWPLLAWSVSFVFASETYRAHYAGEPFREYFVLTWLEYAVPFALAAWLLVRHWPRLAPLPPVADAASAPPGRFAVVVPCRGEAENLRSLVPAWLATPAVRVVLADTPTGDGTKALAAGEARVHYEPVQRAGYGAAVLAGVAAAERKRDVDFVVVCDADHGRGPPQLAALLAPFADPRVGLVTAARIGTSLPPAQRFGNRLASLLIGLGWGVRFHDLGPFRAVRLAAWRAWGVADSGFGVNVEMNVRALESGWWVAEVALPGSEREHGENRISGTWTGVIGAGYGILRRIYRLRERLAWQDPRPRCTPPSSS